MLSATQERCMRLALELARTPRVPPYPNPWVGCVVAKGETILGRGWHTGPGRNHAEVEAIRAAGLRAKGATLYVTLEPCCHHGRTPPCTDAIIAAGIREVVYAIRDPNPQVTGRGAGILRAHGVHVTSGVCSREARDLNGVYLKYRRTGLPLVSLKAGASLDGKTSTRTGQSKWITGEKARRRGRELRVEHQAILAGINTVLHDDPHLGPRLRGMPENWRVILDSRLRTPVKSQVVRSGKCIIACVASASLANENRLVKAGAQVWKFPGKRVPLRPLLKRLAEQGIISVLVEGGSEVLGSFVDQRLADRVYWFISPMLIGSQRARSAVGGKGAALLKDALRLRDARVELCGEGWLVTGVL